MAQADSSVKSTRLHGLDFARFLAFAGMVYVNFHVVTGSGGGSGVAEFFLTMLEGKAAATFVVLAGIGFGLGAARDKAGNFPRTILKRALFLLVIGLLNSLIFPADILHYYALYFAFGLLLIGASTRVIIGVMLILPLVFVGLLGVFNYDAGWNWETLDYVGFWTVEGFLRNLMFNGWHPVVPWLSFLLFGIVLSRLELASARVHRGLIIGGTSALAGAYGLSAILVPILSGEDIVLAGVSPVPPMPLYMLAGSGAAALVVGLSLMIFSKGMVGMLLPLVKTGRQALTLYIAHIIVGMGALEALGLLGSQSAETSIIAASLFIILALLYSNIWARFYRAGPIEWLMRRVAG